MRSFLGSGCWLIRWERPFQGSGVGRLQVREEPWCSHCIYLACNSGAGQPRQQEDIEIEIK